MTDGAPGPTVLRRSGVSPTDGNAVDNAPLKSTNAALARFVHPQLALDLSSAGEITQGVQSLLATILFVDIRGFSELAEQLGLCGTRRLLEEFLSLMVDCIDRNRGTVDKLLGDGLLATFGVPTPGADDADRAVETAGAMLRDIAAWNQRRQSARRPGVRIGIGIDTDLVLAGPIGAPARMDYTVIGDAVNVAAKLQQAGDGDGSLALISARTRAQLVREHQLMDSGMVSIGTRGRQVAAHRLLVEAPEGGRGH